MLDNSLVKDEVTIGLGYHPQLERQRKKTAASFDATIGVCRVEVSKASDKRKDSS
jgi:hypothetical protein